MWQKCGIYTDRPANNAASSCSGRRFQRWRYAKLATLNIYQAQIRADQARRYGPHPLWINAARSLQFLGGVASFGRQSS